MDFFEKYSSNTLAGSGNQYFFTTDDSEKINIGRLYYKIFSYGKHKYSFLFSNIVDSTYADGTVSQKNRVCDSWHINGMRVGVCGSCGENEADEPSEFYPVTFGGKSEKEVMPGEFFATDEIELDVSENGYICIEISFNGKMIPYHEESIVPTFVYKDNTWIPSKKLPFPGMIGCDAKANKKIAFLGDSITQGIGTPVNSYEHWNAKLAEKLGSKYAYWNLGLGYGRADDAASNGAWLYKAKQNDVVFVCFGVNDILQGFSAEQIKNNLKTIVSILKESGIKVVLQTVPPFDYAGTDIEKWENINRYIKEDLSKYSDFVFDNVPILGESDANPYSAKYGGHPNADGCAKWADALYRAIVKNAERIAI